MPFVVTLMDLEIVILSKFRERQTSYATTYTWNLKKKKKKDTNEVIYKIEKDSQTQKSNLWLTKGKGGRRDKLGVWD